MSVLCHNNTVSNRIDMDVEEQLIETLKSRKFSLQMDESTFRDSEALLLTYVRYIMRSFKKRCCSANHSKQP